MVRQRCCPLLQGGSCGEVRSPAGYDGVLAGQGGRWICPRASVSVVEAGRPVSEITAPHRLSWMLSPVLLRASVQLPPLVLWWMWLWLAARHRRVAWITLRRWWNSLRQASSKAISVVVFMVSRMSAYAHLLISGALSTLAVDDAKCSPGIQCSCARVRVHVCVCVRACVHVPVPVHVAVRVACAASRLQLHQDANCAQVLHRKPRAGGGAGTFPRVRCASFGCFSMVTVAVAVAAQFSCAWLT